MCVHAWETDLKKKIACVRWIMPTGSVCACMHLRKLVVATKVRGLCVCACMGDRPEEKDCMCAMDNAEW